jgi:homoserine/homoserine lactone efflux protein
VSLALYLAFVAATLLLLVTPGPNVALIVATSLERGTRFGLWTVAGTSTAMVVQLTLTVFGLSSLQAIAANWFSVLRWLGVLYLLYLGIKAWRTAPTPDPAHVDPRSPTTIVVRGFLVSLTNPKTLMFYGAFLPQFVSPSGDIRTQLILLSVTFIVLAIAVDGTWSVLAARARFWLGALARWRNRMTGACLIGAALGLAFARK